MVIAPVFLLHKADEDHHCASDVIGYGNDRAALEAEAERLEHERHKEAMTRYERGESSGYPIPLDQRDKTTWAYFVTGPINKIQ